MSTLCPKGQVRDAGVCWKACPSGYSGFGPQCFKNCPIGYPNVGLACGKPTLQRGSPFSPSFAPCPAGLRDDGQNCWSSIDCSYVSTPDGSNFELQCTGTNTIQVTREQRQQCPAGFSIYNNMCYATCPSGYDVVGAVCAKPCPVGYSDIPSNTGGPGLQCSRPTQGRNIGGIANGGLRDITSSSRKSTLIERYGTTAPPTATSNASAQQSLQDATDPFTCFTDLINLIGGSGWTNLYNILKAVAFVAILLIIGPLLLPVVNFVTTSLTPIGKGAGEAIGSAVSGVGKVAGKAIETVGETTLANVQDALTQNQALREQLQLTQQLAKAQGQYSQNVRAAKNAQYIQTSPGVFELLQ